MPDYPTDLIDYKITTKKIGEGGSSFIHLAECSQGLVALKVPRDLDGLETLDASVMKSFENEARIWKDLSNKQIKGIVELYAYGSSPYSWMALEYMDSGSLEERIGKLSKEKALEVAVSLLDTLYYAHNYGVIHRDIKPSNILFNSKNEIKLTDWGLGKKLLTDSSQSLFFKGSTRYAAPEQYKPELFGEPDWHTDIFQAGAVIYHIFAGVPPISDPHDAMHTVIGGKIEPLSKVNSEVPTHINNAVMKALAVKKEDRWKSTDSFKSTLLGKSGIEVKCDICNNIVNSINKSLKCKDCGKFFCQTCEDWIDKVNKYSDQKIKARFPLCENCYKKEVKKQMNRIDKEIRAKKKGVDEQQLLTGLTTMQNALKKQRVWAKKLDIPIEIKNTIGMKLRLIPAGEFFMGSDKQGDSYPVHKIKISNSFYIGIYPVTLGEWTELMGVEFNRQKNLPINNVSWKDCKKFIKALNEKENTSSYRLPSEAEWEYACQGGSTFHYPFGPNIGRVEKMGWFGEDISKDTVHPVGKKKPNSWGIHDMHGNVWEWCEDWYGRNYYDHSPREDPRGPLVGFYRIVRGGSWGSNVRLCISVFRNKAGPDCRDDRIGFRVVKEV